MPPPHLAVLNVQEPSKKLAKQPAPKPEAKPARGRIGWLRATVTPPEPAPQVPRRRPPAPDEISLEALQPAAAEAVSMPQPDPEPQPAPPVPPVPPPLIQAVPPPPAAPERVEKPAERRPPQEDLLADLPPAQVPLKIDVSLLPAMPPAKPAAPERQGRNAAAERAFRIGRLGSRPAHAMSAAEVAAWREGAMEAGRSRDRLWGRPSLWWWLALSALLVMPMAYAALWLGLASNGAEFLSTGLGQEAWIIFGGPEAGMVYWGVVFALAMLLQMLRPLEPVLIIGAASYWGWLGLHAAWEVGLLAQRIPPLPMP